MENWREDNLANLFTVIKDRMPPQPERLDEATSLDILAHILRVNTFPDGVDELRANALGTIRIIGKNGPAPLPELALVQVVGCLAQDSYGDWMLINANAAVRIRNAEKPPEEELTASAAQPLGNLRFRLLYPDFFSPGFHIEAYEGHKMEAKGYLVRDNKAESVAITWLQTVAPTCGN